MGLFKRKENRVKEDRAVDPSQRELDSSVVDLFSDEETVTREQALQIPTVQACIGKISEAVSMLPVRLMKKSDGKTEEITGDRRVALLNGDTGDTLNTVEFWKALINDYYVGTGGWAYIDSDEIGAVRSLRYVDCREVSINKNNDPIFKDYIVLVGGNVYYNFKFLKFLRKTKDGFTNIPIQEECSKVISAAFNALKLEIRLNRSSGCKGGFLKSKNKLSKEVIEDIRRGYENLYDSMNQGKNRKILVLNDGMEFQEISATPAEMQLNEIKKANAIEICKIFGFPHTIIDGGASEEDRKQFISAVTAVVNQIETELDKNLLLEEEKESGYYWAFDMKELTRGSQKERYEAYQIALKNRFLQVDEVRKEEDYEPMGFNFVSLGLGDVLLNPQTGEIYTPNTNKLTKINDGTSAEPEPPSDELRARGDNWVKGEHGYFMGSSPGGGSSGGGGSNKSIDKSGESGIIKEEDMINSPIKQTHTGKGNANAILMFDVELNNRQQELLNKLPEYGSKTTVPKDSVNMADLSALTAKTGVEYAMFTKGGERLVLRGGVADVPIYKSDALRLASEGYRWSGHTHPGTNFICLSASAGDLGILNCFPQQTSVIYNSKGEYLTFSKMLGKE